jgi:hypothetical protein
MRRLSTSVNVGKVDVINRTTTDLVKFHSFQDGKLQLDDKLTPMTQMQRKG